MHAAVMVFERTYLPREEAKILKRHLRCDFAAFAIQLSPFLQTATHLVQQMMACYIISCQADSTLPETAFVWDDTA